MRHRSFWLVPGTFFVVMSLSGAAWRRLIDAWRRFTGKQNTVLLRRLCWQGAGAAQPASGEGPSGVDWTMVGSKPFLGRTRLYEHNQPAIDGIVVGERMLLANGLYNM